MFIICLLVVILDNVSIAKRAGLRYGPEHSFAIESFVLKNEVSYVIFHYQNYCRKIFKDLRFGNVLNVLFFWFIRNLIINFRPQSFAHL